MKSTISSLLVALLLALPVSAEDASNQDLFDLYGSGQREQALEKAQMRLAGAPADRALNMLVGRCLADLGRAAEGKPYLQKVVADLQPDWIHAWSQFYLAFIAIQEGDDETARALWTQVRDAKLTENVARNAGRNLTGFALAEAFANWSRVSTANCRFAFSPALADSDRQAFADRHEKAWEQLTKYFGGRPPWQVRYIVWGSEDEARSMAGINGLGFARPEACLVNCRWDQTVGHELAHVVSFHALKPTTRTALINEGLAVRCDLTGRDRLARARDAVAGAGLDSLDIAALWERPPTGQDAWFYPVAGAWVQMLEDRGGRESLFALCREQTLANARAVYGDRLDAWMVEFVAALGL